MPINQPLTKFRIGFIGSGNMARAHAYAFRNMPGVELVGVYSRTSDKTKSFASENGIQLVCSSVKELFQLAKPDMVIIAVSELSLKDICIQAFNYPWKLLIEKPVGINLNEANEIFDMSRRKGAIAYVALNRRHYGSTRGVLQEILNFPGKRLVQVYDQEDPLCALQEGRPEKVVKNWMYANSIHLVDYFQLFCRGVFTSIDHLTKWEDGTASYRLDRLNFSSGDVGIYQAIWDAPGPWAVTVTTSQRKWEMKPLETAISQSYNSRKLDVLPVDPIDHEFKPGFKYQAGEAIKALQGLPHTLPGLEDGLKTMNLIEKIYG